MTDARGQSVSVRIGAATQDGTPTEWAASGRSITFPGYLRAYVEGSDDPSAELEDRESVLPVLTAGDELPDPSLEAKGHTTSPPARYTEASLVKRLEELGIGRPSTYASIMQTIQDRGYVWKKACARPDVDRVRGREPAGAALRRPRRLQLHRPHGGRPRRDRGPPRRREPWLRRFWFGQEDNGAAGLKVMVDRGLDEIGAAAISTIPLGIDGPGTSSSSSRVGTGPT